MYHKELYDCFHCMKMDLEQLRDMPIRNRKFYIELHNRGIEQRREDFSRKQAGLRDVDPNAWMEDGQ